MSLRRGSIKLKALGKSHGPLRIILWQAKETESTLLAAAAAQKTLFSDIAAWASSENRALNDVCSSASELSSLYNGVLKQLAHSFKSFRKEMNLVLEGEERCDSLQKRLQEAEQSRIKLRRQVVRSQNRTITERNRRSGDFTQMQAQLAEAERSAERAHVEACTASREQEAVKLVVLRSALSKLSQSHVSLASQVKTIFNANNELANLLPEPPPPGDPLSCIRYTNYDAARTILDRVRLQVGSSPGGDNMNDSVSSTTSSRRSSSGGSTRRLSMPVPMSGSHSAVTLPNTSMWSGDPSAPNEPPPPYNTNYISSSTSQLPHAPLHSRMSSLHIGSSNAGYPNHHGGNLRNYHSTNSVITVESSSSPTSSSNSSSPSHRNSSMMENGNHCYSIPFGNHAQITTNPYPSPNQ